MRSPLSRRRPVLALIGAGIAALATAALSVPPNALPTTASKLSDRPVNRQYKVFDAKGRPKAKATWRVTTAGGNCCEVLVAAMPSGKLVEFGGTYPAYSDDRGVSWTEIAPLTPSTSRQPNPGPRKLGGGEGTLVMAPGGDILGIGWDPYSGDRLQSFLYSRAEQKWYYNEAPLHEPFYDREWVGVAKGPFTINGTEVPWVSYVVSGFHGGRVVLMSTDGLNYFTPTQRDADLVRNGSDTGLIPVARDSELDWLQPHTSLGVAPLPGGGALSWLATASSCDLQRLNGDGTWSCFEFAGGYEFDPNSRLLADSRGWLHVVRDEGTSFGYDLSKDGGRTWTSREFVLPGEPSIESWDFKTNGRLGVTAILAHAKKDDGKHQDYVLRLDTKKGAPVHRDTLLVGDGNYTFTDGLSVQDTVAGASYRVDFASVAILPDGKVAVSFADKTYLDPALAILLS